MVVAPTPPSVDRAPRPRRRGAESTKDPFKNVGQKGQSRRATLGNVLGWYWRGGAGGAVLLGNYGGAKSALAEIASTYRYSFLLHVSS